MKCVSISGVKSFKLEERSCPEKRKDKVVFKVNKCGICGSDLHYFVNGEPNGLVMGHEFSGVIVDPGDRSDLKVGDRITALPLSPCGKCDACKSGNPQYCINTWTHATGLSLENSGAYSEYSSCYSNMARLIPEEVTDEEAAMVEPAAVSLHAVKLADIMVGDKVLIVGGGVIGLLASEFAKKEGATYVCMLETNEKRGLKSLSLGSVDEFYNPTNSDIIKTLKEKTNGGFDIVIECCGNSAAVSEAIMLVKNGGKIVLVGVSTEPVTVPLVVSVMGEVTMLGSIAYSEFDFDKVIELIKNKDLNVIKYIDKVVSLEEVEDACKELTSGESSAIKILIDPSK